MNNNIENTLPLSVKFASVWYLVFKFVSYILQFLRVFLGIAISIMLWELKMDGHLFASAFVFIVAILPILTKSVKMAENTILSSSTLEHLMKMEKESLQSDDEE